MTNNSAPTISSSPTSIIYERPKAAHSVFDNLQGQLFGVVMTSFGIAILHAAGLVTGQAAGLSFVISYATGIDFGILFFLVNLPFYLLALARIGVGFTDTLAPVQDFMAEAAMPGRLVNLTAGAQLYSNDSYDLRAEYKAGIGDKYLSQEVSARLSIPF